MNDIDENLVPELAPNVDPKSLEIDPTPEEFFVLSRVDGSTTIEHICRATGLGKEKTLACIENLRDYGLLQLPGDQPPGVDNGVSDSSTEDTPVRASSSPSSPDESKDASSQSNNASSRSKDDSPNAEDDDQLGRAIRSRFAIPFADFEFDEELLAQQVELDDDFKSEVLFVYEQLDQVDYYQLLGVDRDAGRRQLRGSYFKMSKRYHPDRFYQKILGDFQQRIEKIFQRVTKAYQTLSNRNKRSEYDASLTRGRQNHATPVQASTPASQQSDTREDIKGPNKRGVAAKVLVQRGDRSMKTGDIDAAVREYRKALTIKRDGKLAMRVAAALLDLESYLDDAILFARAAVKITQESPKALKLLAEAYDRKGASDEALYHYEKAAKAAPEDSDVQQRIEDLRS